MSTGFASTSRLTLLAGVVLCGFGAVALRLVQLHVLDRDRLMAGVDRARHEIIIEQARRGDILDAHGDLLATSRTEITLAIDPWALTEYLEGEKNLPRRERLRQAEQEKRAALAARLGMPAAELERLYVPTMRAVRPQEDLADGTPDGRVRDRWVRLRDGVDEALFATIQQDAPRGLTHARSFVRTYPHNQLAPHVIGFVNKQGDPAQGMEAWANFYLRGADGWRESEKDGRQNELAQFRTREVPSSPGWTVMLSLDSVVQGYVEQELAAIGTKYQPLKATIIVSDPRTGFLLALGNYPGFDLNRYNEAPQEEDRRLKSIASQVDLGGHPREGVSIYQNIAATDEYEPGSVFKIVAASAALEAGLVTPASTFDCSVETVSYRGLPRHLPREDHSFDHPLTVAEIISHSSNRGAAQLAMLVGEERFYSYARAFGFGERTGLPGGPEVNGKVLMPGSAEWHAQTITRMPMGQSVAVTVLQMHQAMGVIASGGQLLEPQIVRQIRDAAGETIWRFDRAVKHRVISELTARTMAQLLMGVASRDGTAPEAAIPGFEVAGKTGTSQKLDGGKYSEHHHVASFVGFFPASNPQVAISVIVDDADAHSPGGVAYGAKVAAPAFKELGEKLIQYLEIKPPAGLLKPGLIALEGGRR